MSEPRIPFAPSTFAKSAQVACLSGLGFIAPGTPIPRDGVVYRSRGSLLVTGDSPAVAGVARELARWAPKLRIALFAPGAGGLATLPPTVKAVGTRIASLRGYLGHFAATIRVAADKLEDAGIFSGNEDRHFDLVLDLCREPLLRQSVLPHGYYAPGADPVALAAALHSLSQLTGEFHKPKYVDYRPQLCAHGAMGVVGCTRCLQACDAAAIWSTGERIEVDPFLCQGCATCALVCPTGALSFQRASPEGFSASLEEARNAQAANREAPIVVLHDAASRHLLAGFDHAGTIRLEVNPLAAFADLSLLSILASGIAAVVLVVAPDTAPRSLASIERKLAELRAIVVSLGGDVAALRAATPANLGVVVEQISDAAVAPAPTFVATASPSADDKRARFLAVADTLARHWQSDNLEPCPLPAEASFGNVLVDSTKCTLCHACTYLCPTGALSGAPVGEAQPAPVLRFREGLCVQCDLCRAGCPEKAITLQARFLPDAASRDVPRELARDELVPCRGCGTPYIGRRKLAASLALMREHAPEMPGGLDSLRLCPACRQRETMAL